MDASLQIGKAMGIPVRLHLSFLLIIPWVAYIFSGFSEPIFGKIYGFGAVEPVETRWIYSLAFAVLLFVCIGLHELGHSFVAMRYGIRIKSITLYIFGGVAAMESIPKDAKKELRIAVAGPLVSGVLALGLILGYIGAAAILGEAHSFPILLWTLGIMNLILMAFNLIPAFPMDGGRVLRAWFSTRMPYTVATSNAAGLGRIFAVLLIFLGIFTGGFMTLIVGIFLYMGASEEERATTISDSLAGIRVKHIMSREVRTIRPDMPLSEIVELMFREKHRGYPVMDGDSLQGIVTITDLQRIPDDRRASLAAGDVMTRNIYYIGPEDEATTAMRMMTERKIRRLPVIEDGKLIGIVSREDLVRAIELCSDLCSDLSP